MTRIRKVILWTVCASFPLLAQVNIIAHRGLIDSNFPENTISAVVHACQSDVWGIEYDVRLTKDGELVVCHDSNIKGTSDGEGDIHRLTLKELRKHNFGHKKGLQGICIPTFDAIFDICNAFGKYQVIEIKNVKLLKQGKLAIDIVAKKILDTNAQEKAVIASFSTEILRYAHEKYPEIATLFFIGERNHNEVFSNGHISISAQESYIEQCLRTVKMVGVRSDYLTEGIIGEFHQRGLEINAWTNRDEIDDKEYHRLLKIEVNSITMENFGTASFLQR